jgi:hypothetical protein
VAPNRRRGGWAATGFSASGPRRQARERRKGPGSAGRAHQARHVVTRPRVQGQLTQRAGTALGVGPCLHALRQPAVVHYPREALGAQEHAVAGAQGHGPDFGPRPASFNVDLTKFKSGPARGHDMLLWG